jgi:uncharacterized protein (TIRG00374 family)
MPKSQFLARVSKQSHAILVPETASRSMTTMATKNGKRSWISIVLRLGLGLALTIWAVWHLDWGTLVDSFRHIHLIWVAATVVLFLTGLALKLLRWRWLLADLAPRISWLALARAMSLGQAVNIIGLGRFGEVARVISLRQDAGVSGVGAATSVVAEKLLDLAFLGLAGGWWVLLLLRPPSEINVTQFLLTGAASGLAVLLFALMGQSILRWLQARLDRWDRPAARWLAPRTTAMAEGLKGLTQHDQLGRGLLISIVIWCVMLLTNMLLFLAFDLPFSGRLGLSVLVMGLLGVAANLTPANIGPEHWAIMFGMTLFGVMPSIALAYALVLHAIVTVVPLVLALAFNGWHWAELRSLGFRPTPREAISEP